MWISKNKYMELLHKNSEIEKTYLEKELHGEHVIQLLELEKSELKQKNESMQKILTRKQVLALEKFDDLVRYAEIEHGIRPNAYEDKTDLIVAILDSEKWLRSNRE